MSAMKVEDITACAASFFRLAAKAQARGIELDPDEVETVLCEDNQSVSLTIEVAADEYVHDQFRLTEPTTEAQFYGN